MRGAESLRSAFGLRTFLDRLIAVFGWRYVVTVAAEYGVNQGAGLTFVNGAMRFYAFDELGVSAAEWGRMLGFGQIPWMLKAIFGLISDTLPINGLHRAPYLIIAGGVGLGGCLLLAFPRVGAGVAAGLFLLTQLNVALADVIIDATVAERCKAVPEQAARLQSLSWGSLGLFAAVSSAATGCAPSRAPAGPPASK